MDIQFYGANCLSITAQGVRLVVDDNLADLGAKSVTKAGDVVLFTGPHAESKPDARIVVDHPGEYEVADWSIYGIPMRAHMDEANARTATIYKILVNDTRVLVLGHVYPELSDTELERIGVIDVLVIPVGGNGYTLDPVGALQLIKKIEPKLIIPTHYADKSLNYPVPQQSLEDVVRGLAMEPAETVSKLRIRQADLAGEAKLVIVERT